MTGGGGDVEDTAQAKHADREVAQAGHDARAVGGADLGAVFVVGDVADPVQAVLDQPVPSEDVGQFVGADLVRGASCTRTTCLATTIVSSTDTTTVWTGPANPYLEHGWSPSAPMAAEWPSTTTSWTTSAPCLSACPNRPGTSSPLGLAPLSKICEPLESPLTSPIRTRPQQNASSPQQLSKASPPRCAASATCCTSGVRWWRPNAGTATRSPAGTQGDAEPRGPAAGAR
jgi:hypothetical protein